MIDFIYNIIFLVIQWILLWFIYYQVTGIKVNWIGFTTSIFFSFLGALLFGSLWCYLILPYLLIYGRFYGSSFNFPLIYFHSLYTAFIPLLLINLISLTIYLLTPIEIFNNYQNILIISTVLIAILFHFGVIKLLKIDFSILTLKNSFIENQILKPVNIALTIEFLFFSIVYFFQSNALSEPVNEYTKYIFFIYFFLFFTLLGFLAIQDKNFLQQEIQNVKAENYKQTLPYYLEIERLYRELAGFRHDFVNIMITLDESINTGNIKEVRAIYDEILSETKKDINRTKFDTAELMNISNPAVKSVLSAKALFSKQKNVQIELEIKQEISLYYIDILDYIRIISNLLDNAIEAAELAKEKKVIIAIFYRDDLLFTRIENTRDSSKITIDKMFTFNYSTKGNNRGKGLSNVQDILQKYNNAWIETKITEAQIIQTIITKKVIKSERLPFGR
ncbi:GHKL domain-containing protein [Listeria monocytogenes]